MKCPKCGNEIKEGHLYCDICGEEIRIVPDFDETVDGGINISFTDDIDTDGVIEGLNNVATKEIVSEIEKEATKEININTDKKPDDKYIIKALVFAGAICVVLVFLVFFANKKVNSFYSVDNQYEKAFEQYEAGEYNDSIKTLKHAIDIAPDDERLKTLLADNYYRLEKYDESNAVLYELKDEFTDDPFILEKIIVNNEGKGDYNAINRLLQECDDKDLKEAYSRYLAEDVSFSVDDGSYDEIKFLELSSSEGSTIYYTTDGEEPNEKSYIYSEPIELDAGEYIITAVAVNEYGIKSDVLSKEYIIDFFVPDKPILKTKSAVYNVPVPIEISCPDYDLCYYTIDGDDPTLEDELYQGPIPMFIGKHTYKFAVISNKGIASETVELNATLDLIILVDMETAENTIINYKASKGSQEYSYECEQACTYNNSTYYIINEYENSEGGKELTGNHYAVDVLTGLAFRAILNKSTGEFKLEALI